MEMKFYMLAVFVVVVQVVGFILNTPRNNKKYAQITKADWKAVKERAILMQSDSKYIDGFFRQDELIALKKLAANNNYMAPPMPSQREGGEHA